MLRGAGGAEESLEPVYWATFNLEGVEMIKSFLVLAAITIGIALCSDTQANVRGCGMALVADNCGAVALRPLRKGEIRREHRRAARACRAATRQAKRAARAACSQVATCSGVALVPVKVQVVEPACCE